MTRTTTRRRFLAGGAASALASLAGCTGFTPFVGQRLEDDRTVDAADVERVRFDYGPGSLRVRTADRDDVAIEYVRQSSSVTADVEDLELRTERDGDTLVVSTVWTGSTGLLGGAPSMDLDVSLPTGIAVEAIDGSVGSVDLAGTAGDLTVDVSTASVTVVDHDGDLRVDSSTGSITAERIDGTVSADASTGSITVREPAALGDVSASTGSVDVDVPAIDGDTRIETSTGSVAAALDPALDAELDVSTSTGSISVRGLDADLVVGDDVAGGTLNDGGPTLRIDTSTGSITVSALE